jgi:glycosyltransferase involved in cell wall biosynthesis
MRHSEGLKELLGGGLMPQVSVIMPCHNAGKWVADAIGSVLAQTYGNFELIVVDDGSKDASWEILQTFASDPRVRLLRNDSNIGQSASANRGYAEAKGDYIKFFDADDLLSHDFLEAQVRRLVGRTDAVASASWGRFYGDNTDTFRPNPEPVWKDMESTEWLVDSWIDCKGLMQCALWLIPRQILERTGPWNAKLSLINDFEFFSRVLCAAKEVLFCPEAVLYYRSGTPGTLSGQKSRAAYESMTESILLGTGHLLARRQDDRARLAAANVCQHGVYDLYPQHHDLRRKLEARIKECGGSNVPPFGGTYFHALRPFIGWKLAKRLQKLAGR